MLTPRYFGKIGLEYSCYITSHVINHWGQTDHKHHRKLDHFFFNFPRNIFTRKGKDSKNRGRSTSTNSLHSFSLWPKCLVAKERKVAPARLVNFGQVSRSVTTPVLRLYLPPVRMREIKYLNLNLRRAIWERVYAFSDCPRSGIVPNL